MLNRIFLMGRLTRDPELRRTGSGVPVASLSIAVDRDRTEGGTRPTDFFDIVAWRSTAEFISKYFTKGRMIVVTGPVHMRRWQDKQGNNRISFEVNAEQAWFADTKKSEGTGDLSADLQSADAYHKPPVNVSVDETDFAAIDDDEELPF